VLRDVLVAAVIAAVVLAVALVVWWCLGLTDLATVLESSGPDPRGQ
jgi:ABC-type uncharacterized transport system permease subunit